MNRLTLSHLAFPSFLSVGLLGLLINTAVLVALREYTQLPLYVASLLAGEVALLHNYLLHCIFTFQRGRIRKHHLLLFHATALATLALSSLLLAGLVQIGSVAYPVANVIAVLMASVINYLLIARWAWRELPVGSQQQHTPHIAWRTIGLCLLAGLGGLALMALVAWASQGNWLSLPVLLVALVMFAQSTFSLYLMLYAWERPERLAASAGPTSFLPPQHSFTVLLPARHEEAVIFQTIQRVWAANYPKELLEIVVICHADDRGTIAEAQRAIQALGSPQVRVETFMGTPINKPRGLNVGLWRTHNEIVTIFDAEDDIDTDIFNIVNTVMAQEKVGVVQAGVQLMNFTDRWFSIHNCLEYFFWFKSRLHFHASVGMIPLGGNTVFIRRNLLQKVGGWDEQCLTEDADVGIRLSALGERIRVVYDARHVTREETPDTVEQFIKQRTRWHQGFLQVLRKGDWRLLPQGGQRALALYTLSYPLFQGMLTLLWPVTLLTVVGLKIPVLATMIAFLPLYALLFQLLACIVGAWMFTREYGLKFPLLLPISMTLTFLPFQLLLGISAVRAVWREARRENGWEKTRHLGAHRRVTR
jgi:cellulose synthase/poly-beta-1,6-N-acetylglucosamine synthase-like glycosyltransferase/putative flippase GtrA